MKPQVKNWYAGDVLFSFKGSLRIALEAQVKQGTVLRGADLRNADLHEAVLRDSVLPGVNFSGANLRGSDLRDSDLSEDANFSGANLQDADLRRCDLHGVDFQDADLQGALFRDSVLRGADFRRSNLDDVDLQGADLQGADFQGAKNVETIILDTNGTMHDYIEQIMPALLVAGGKTIEEVAAGWDCHDWGNCPMSIAFSVHRLDDVPILFRLRARQFVDLFDARLLPRPTVATEAAP